MARHPVQKVRNAITVRRILTESMRPWAVVWDVREYNQTHTRGSGFAEWDFRQVDSLDTAKFLLNVFDAGDQAEIWHYDVPNGWVPFKEEDNGAGTDS